MENLIEFLAPPDSGLIDLDKYRGVMLGLAVGNALGLRVEGWPAEEIRRRFGRITNIAPAERDAAWDDDVAQAVILAEAILDRDRLDLKDLASRFLHWFGADPRGIGLLTLSVMRELAKGTPAENAARLVWVRSGGQSAGNGAVMRCWPVTLRWHGAPDRLITEARTSALITHHDPRCEWSTVASVAIAALVLGNRPLDTGSLSDALKAAGAPVVVGEALRGADRASLKDFQLDDARAMGYTLKAMQVSTWSAAQESDFEGVVGAVVNAGGDTDTNGAVAGAVMGARVGLDGIPERWGGAVARREELIELADRLREASEMGPERR